MYVKVVGQNLSSVLVIVLGRLFHHGNSRELPQQYIAKAMQLSFKYCIDPEAQKTKERRILRQKLQLRVPSKPKLLQDAKDWQDQTCKMEE